MQKNNSTWVIYPAKKNLAGKKADMSADTLDTVINSLFDEQSADSSTVWKRVVFSAHAYKLIELFDKKILTSAGNVSHENAIEKAEQEYHKYQAKTFSPVENAYLDSIKNIQKQVEKNTKSKN